MSGATAEGMQADGTEMFTAYRGEMPRAETNTVLGTGERQARRIASALLEKGVLTSENPRAPLRLAFPAALASRWMPGLFPEKAD